MLYVLSLAQEMSGSIEVTATQIMFQSNMLLAFNFAGTYFRDFSETVSRDVSTAKYEKGALVAILAFSTSSWFSKSLNLSHTKILINWSKQ